jgi:hypothetical protein
MNATIFLMLFWAAVGLSYLAVYRRELPALSGAMASVLWLIVAIGALGYEVGSGGRAVVFSSVAVAFLASGFALLSAGISVLDLMGELPEIADEGEVGR